MALLKTKYLPGYFLERERITVVDIADLVSPRKGGQRERRQRPDW
jgi:hypothetical protein